MNKAQSVTFNSHSETAPVPCVFNYLDPRTYLNHWIEYKLATNSGFSLTGFSKKIGFQSNAYLSKILNGTRGISGNAFDKLTKHLNLNQDEQNYLELLRAISKCRSQEERKTIFERIRNFRKIKGISNDDLDTYQYLSHWYYVAIREMALLSDFKSDPVWIQSKLRYPISIQEITEALSFLIRVGHLEQAKDGKILPKTRELNCSDGVYRLALGDYYSQLLGLAKESITKVARGQRFMRGCVVPIPTDKLPRIMMQLGSFLESISKEYGLDMKNSDQVVSLNLLAFPLTFGKLGNEDDK